VLAYANRIPQPNYNVLMQAVDLPPAPARGDEPQLSAFLLPSFKYAPRLATEQEIRHLAESHILPRTSPHATGPIDDGSVREVRDVFVLICGHNARDIRCGRFGPALRDMFAAALPGAGLPVATGPPEEETTGVRARLGLTSHVGGHAFAGNVIVYVPPGMKSSDGRGHSLAGCGVWYGRVEPRHVEGIVKETILGGRIIRELFRGGVGPDREVLRLSESGGTVS
jgi:(2Fe-2S) ferredoxin